MLDVMPTDGSVLLFHNRWYGHAVRTAVKYRLAAGWRIRITAAPAFLATKWDAFHDRGADDWYGSHDLEDIITVVAGRPELPEEISSSDEELVGFLVSQTRELVESTVHADVVAGALPDVRLVPGLLDRVLERFHLIQSL